MAVRTATGPTIADAAEDGGALEGGEVGVGEMEGGVAFNDGDVGVAEETEDIEITADEGELGCRTDGQGEVDARVGAFGSFDLEMEAGV